MMRDNSTFIYLFILKVKNLYILREGKICLTIDKVVDVEMKAKN